MITLPTLPYFLTFISPFCFTLFKKTRKNKLIKAKYK